MSAVPSNSASSHSISSSSATARPKSAAAMSPQVSRFAALGLLILLVLAMIIYGLLPLVQGYVDRADEISMLDKRLSTLRSLLANEPLVDQELERLASLKANSDIFLQGNKVAIASAKLREFVSDSVEDSGGALVSTQDYETQSLDTASAVGLRVQFNGEIEHLSRFLHKLESAQPLIFIDKITITSSAAQRNKRLNSRARRSSRARSARMSLTVRLDIFGYMVAGEA